MNSAHSAEQDLAHIRKVMDSRARLLSFSGYSTIASAVLWTAALVWLGPDLDERLKRAPRGMADTLAYLRPELIGLAGLLALCLVTNFLFTYREARRNQEPLLGKGGANIALSLGLYLGTGFLFCLALLPISPAMTAAAILVLYGLMIAHVARYSRFDVAPLGLGCVAAGLYCAYTGQAWLSLLVGFGAFHLIYGIWAEMRKSRTP